MSSSRDSTRHFDSTVTNDIEMMSRARDCPRHAVTPAPNGRYEPLDFKPAVPEPIRVAAIGVREPIGAPVQAIEVDHHLLAATNEDSTGSLSVCTACRVNNHSAGYRR